MNNNLYNEPNYIPNQSTNPPIITQQPYYNNQKYASDLLERNVGKKVKIYASFSDSIDWRNSIYDGIIEETGKDYILIYDQNNNKRFLIWSVYLDYIEFEEQLNRGY